MAKTSIHIEPIKPTSERHNTRAQHLDYVHPELTANNESWVGQSVADCLDSVKSRYFKTVGQQMQKKATPIREGVVVVKPTTTMQDLHNLSAKLSDEFGIKAIQIHLHRDEGVSLDQLNHHAHIVFDWTTEDGKSIKLNKTQLSQIQTITADVLGMERGKSSDVQHLNAVQFKIEQEGKRLEEVVLQKQTEEKKLDSTKKGLFGRIATVYAEKRGNIQEEIEKAVKTAKNAFLAEIKKLKQIILQLQNRNKVLEEKVQQTSKDLEREKAVSANLRNRLIKKHGDKYIQHVVNERKAGREPKSEVTWGAMENLREKQKGKENTPQITQKL